VFESACQKFLNGHISLTKLLMDLNQVALEAQELK